MARAKVVSAVSTTSSSSTSATSVGAVTLPHKSIAAALEGIMVGSTHCYDSLTRSVGIKENAVEVIDTWNQLQAILDIPSLAHSLAHSHSTDKKKTVSLSSQLKESKERDADTIRLMNPEAVGSLMLPALGLAVSDCDSD